MTVHQLRILMAAAKSLNITKAAESLGISQPSATQQLRLLEEEYGLKLYETSGRGIKLTEAGKDFINYAEQILGCVKKLDEHFKDRASRVNGDLLKIGGAYPTTLSLLPLAIVAFKKLHPEVQLALETHASRRIQELVQDRKLDIGVIFTRRDLPGLTYIPFGNEKIVAIVSSAHPLAMNREISLEKMEGIPLLVGQSGREMSDVERLIRETLKDNTKLNIVMRAQTPSVITAVKGGAGLGIVYRGSVEHDIATGELKLVKIRGVNRKVFGFIVCRVEQPLTSSAREFIRFLRRWSRNTP